VLKHSKHATVLAWKKSKGKERLAFPGELYLQAIEVINRYFQGFDIITVPAPSYHTYEDYPIWSLAQKLAADCPFPLQKLFPIESGRSRMGWHGALQKEVQEIACNSNQFVLILDDILTTGHTARVSCEAVLNCGSFPCFLAFSEHTQ
jgi:hypothetical protein